jgi:hypothetical protein
MLHETENATNNVEKDLFGAVNARDIDRYVFLYYYFNTIEFEDYTTDRPRTCVACKR